MRHHIAFLHTSPVHIETFDRLVKACDANIRLEHIVAEALLADAQALGVDNPALIQRIQAAMMAASANGAAIVVCTCSTIGGVAERTPSGGNFIAARIDRAMADRACQNGPRVLIVAALESTLAPTQALIEESASALGVVLEPDTLLVPDAWPHFQRGDRDAYLAAVVATVRATIHTSPQRADVIVLAQASMAAAVDALQDIGIEVLASPALGVQSMMATLGLGPTPSIGPDNECIKNGEQHEPV